MLLSVGCPALYATRPRYGRPTKAIPGQYEAGGKDAREGKLAWPVVGKVVQSFGLRIDTLYGTKTHSLGLDIECARGSPVRAADTGRVSFADRFMGYGQTVIVDHGGRLHSIYSRLADIKVQVGNAVGRSTIIGFSSDTLHFEVRKEGRAVDPRQWLAPR